MTQSSKRGLFASVFASKKKKEEELEAEQESRRKLELRIREVLVIADPPRLDTFETRLDPAFESKCDVGTGVENAATAELLPANVVPSIPSEPAKEPEYTYLYLSTAPETQRKSPSTYRSALQTLTPARASEAR
jgi:hypothetical protein